MSVRATVNGAKHPTRRSVGEVDQTRQRLGGHDDAAACTCGAQPASGGRACHICHNGRNAGQSRVPDSLAALDFGQSFPSTELVEASAALLQRREAWDGSEAYNSDGTGAPARRSYIRVSPGSIQVLSRDVNRAEHTTARARAAREVERAAADAATRRDFESWKEVSAQTFLETEDLAALPDFDPDWTNPPSERQRIREWSAKSRANMVRKYAQLDYASMMAKSDALPAMVTLTYPGCSADAVHDDRAAGRLHECDDRCPWTDVVPDGRYVKKHMKALRKRLTYTWGKDADQGLWKLEFQRRGAPHLHLFLMIPMGVSERIRPDGTVLREDFATWLSRAWSEIVGHPSAEVREAHRRAGTGIDYSEGVRAKDPQRLAVYFSKHSAATVGGRKEYQHEVPARFQNVGRFWGYWRLEPVTATVDVSPEHALAAARTLRRWYRAKGLTRKVKKWRSTVDRETGEVRWRPRNTTVRITRMQRDRGFITANDGPALLAQLSRYLDQVERRPERARAAPLRADMLSPASRSALVQPGQ